MITTDFAPNESWDDAMLSLRLLFQPWKWKRGKELRVLNKKILTYFSKNVYLNNDRNKMHIYFYLSGRTALYNLLKSFSLPKDSAVNVQAFTCEAVVLPIIELGLKPIYVDIESETFSMDYRSLINRLTDNSRVLILQHTFGLTPKFRNEILKLAKKRNLTVIEDLAHGFNPAIFQTSNQSLVTNHYMLLSFGRSKLLSSVFGGAISSTDYRLTDQLKNLKYPSSWFIFRCLIYKPLAMVIKSVYDIYLGKILHFILSKFGLLIPEISEKEKKGKFNLIFNKAYPNALGILLLHQLKKFERIMRKRAKICQIYTRSLKKNNQLLTINNWSMIRYPLLVDVRDEILAKARKRNIFLGIWYDQVVGPKELDLDRVEYSQGTCPKAEEICKKIINLPTNISGKEAEKIVEGLGLSERSESKA